MKYATIVADPPWPLDESWPAGRLPKGATHDRRRRSMPYGMMSLAQIAALPVVDLAAPDAHLYLWTIDRFLRDAFGIVEAWGFKHRRTLLWAKTPMGVNSGGAFGTNGEFVLFARRGREIRKRQVDSMWFNWPRTGKHSKKPEAFQDLVEQVSPGPYLELFARRHRLGWDVWGNQVESTIALAAD